MIWENGDQRTITIYLLNIQVKLLKYTKTFFSIYLFFLDTIKIK